MVFAAIKNILINFQVFDESDESFRHFVFFVNSSTRVIDISARVGKIRTSKKRSENINIFKSLFKFVGAEDKIKLRFCLVVLMVCLAAFH